MGFTRREFITLLAGWSATATAGRVFAAAPANKVIRLGTVAPKGSSYYKHLQVMGEKWRSASAGAVTLTIYADATMGGEADMVRRMRLGQLQAGMLTANGLAQIEPAATGLQSLPVMFRNLEEVDYIGEKLRPMLEKRLEEKGFVALFWSDTGWVRFFSKQPIIHPQDMKKAKLFSWAGSAAQLDVYRSAGWNPISLETTDILPNLQTGLINAIALPPSYALAGQVDVAAPNMLDLAWAPLVGALVMTKKAWDGIPAPTQEAMRQAAAEAGTLIKADGRRESVESVEAMKQRGLKVHPVTPDVLVEWQKEVELAYPKIKNAIVPADIFDEVVRQLAAYRARLDSSRS
jgi:TRAP-type C4-dicarboxylate transport system substrate-binding protein